MRSSTPRIELRLLGGFAAVVDGEPVDDRGWRGRKPQQLVKLLAVSPGHKLHREQIVDNLWPQLDPSSADNQLHKAIHAARRALEPGLESRGESRFVSTQDRLVALNVAAGIDVDADAFEEAAEAALAGADLDACERAAALYAGDLLPGDLYEEWTTHHRDRLAALAERLLTHLAELYLQSDRVDQSVETFAAVLARDATSERAHRGLMLAYGRLGDRHRALQQFRLCEQALEAELGVEPDAETRDLYEAILEGAIGRDVAPQSGELSASGAAPSAGSRTERAALGEGAPAGRAPRRSRRAAVLAAVAAVLFVPAVLLPRAIHIEAARLLGSGEELLARRGETTFVALAGRLDAPGVHVEAVGSKSGWACVTDASGRFVLPDVEWSPGARYEIVAATEIEGARLLEVRAPAAFPDGGVVEVGDLAFASGRSVDVAELSGLNATTRVAFDAANREWYRGVFEALTVNEPSDEAKLLALKRFVASRYDKSGPPRQPASPREALERGTRFGGALVRAMASLAYAGGYDVRMVDMTTERAGHSHMAVEVLYEGAWRLFDPVLGVEPRDEAGKVTGYGDLRRWPHLAESLAVSDAERLGWPTDKIAAFYRSGVHHTYVFDPARVGR